jgi:hypothetical protein
MMNDIETTYKTEASNSKVQSVLNSSLKTTILVAKILAFLYSSTGILFYATPLAIYYLTGELLPFLEAYIPGLDYKTPQGYMLTMILQFFFILCGVCGTFGFDLLFFVFYYHIVTLNQLMKIKMEEVGEYLEKNDAKPLENVKDVKDMMKEFYEQHRDMLKCVELKLYKDVSAL